MLCVSASHEEVRLQTEAVPATCNAADTVVCVRAAPAPPFGMQACLQVWKAAGGRASAPAAPAGPAVLLAYSLRIEQFAAP